ncbi:MAG TPA: nicotinate-nucleotide--dimethylbenzimidazole phosphoribosyltransferase, partial [Planctomycetaceae bacterium]|nr:nicotinate-nucleotide--dimethylbenzimidazole phosphoribosyltransferase [Planctomycetaceae bacterium]
MGVAADLSGLAEKGEILDKKVGPGTGNIASGPAMTRNEAIRSVEAGIEAVDHVAQEGLDVLGTGDMGIGNTTPSSAIVAVVTNRPVREVTGRGTGLDDAALAHKIAVIERAIETNQPNRDDPIDVLAKVGGFEIGGLMGAVLGAAARKIPIIIDGLISSAGALLAAELAPHAKDYVIASHQSVEIGHRAIHEHLGLKPYLDLGLRLGEGTGAALAMHLVDAAVRILSEMSTFSEAGVSRET